MVPGEKDEFGLALRGYIPPSVRCLSAVLSTRPVWTDCQAVIAHMNVRSEPVRFGARGAQGVQEVLPKTLSMSLLSLPLGFSFRPICLCFAQFTSSALHFSFGSSFQISISFRLFSSKFSHGS